jgi:serine/threonine protein kinase
MAPDVVKNDDYTQKVDVYSFGIILWEMIERKDPYPDMQPIDIILAAKEGKRPAFSAHNIKNPTVQLIRQCWHEKAKQRPTFTQVVETLQGILTRYDANVIET